MRTRKPFHQWVLMVLMCLIWSWAFKVLLLYTILNHFLSKWVWWNLLFCHKFYRNQTFRKLLGATVRKGVAGKFYWIGSDSWGAKIHPVRDQEWAAEGAITILPKRNNIEGKCSGGKFGFKFTLTNVKCCEVKEDPLLSSLTLLYINIYFSETASISTDIWNRKNSK